MSVKRSRSAARVLSVLEGIAYHQPVGVTELSRRLGDDKSAVQRALMTLADGGWITAAPGQTTRWQLTPHILTVAHAGHFSDDLGQRARPVLDALRARCGETVLLAVPAKGCFVVVDVMESQHVLRSAPYVGMVVPVRGSATSRALLAYMAPEQQRDLLGGPPDQALLQQFAETRSRGYAISAGDVARGSSNIAAPVFEHHGQPVAALVISAPSDRLGADQFERVGALLRDAAARLSRSPIDSPARLTAMGTTPNL